MAISRVQTSPTNGWESGSGNNTLTITFSSNVVRGNRIIIVLRWGGGFLTNVLDSGIASVTDSVNTKYNAFAYDVTTDPALSIIDGVAPASGANTVTIVFSQAASNGPNFTWGVALEYQASSASMAIRRDLNAAAAGSHRGTGTTDMTSAAVSTDGSSGLVIYGCSQSNLTDYTLGANISTLINGAVSPLNNGNHAGAIGQSITAAPVSSNTGHFTSTVTNNFCMVHAAWREDVAAPAKRYFATSFWGSGDSGDQRLELWETDDGLTFVPRPSEYWGSPLAHANGAGSFLGACRNGTTYKKSGIYYLVHSEATSADLFINCPAMSVASSVDGCLFVPLARQDFSATFDDFYGCHWFIDPADGSEHIVFGGFTTGQTSSKPYEIHPVTPGDYTVWSTPAIITGLPTYAGDVQIFKSGSFYYAIFNNAGVDFRPDVYKSSSPFSGYSALRTGDWMSDGVTYTTTNDDGPALYKIGSTWLFYRDNDFDPGPINGVGAIYNTQAVGAGDWTGTNATAWGGPTTFGVPSGASILLQTLDLLDLTPPTTGTLFRVANLSGVQGGGPLFVNPIG